MLSLYQLSCCENGFHPLAITLPEPDPHAGFVGTLIFAEPNIEVDFEKTLVDLWYGIDLRSNAPKSFTHCNDKFPDRAQNKLIVALATFLEPIFRIMLIQIFKKSNQLFGKAIKIGHNTSSWEGFM